MSDSESVMRSKADISQSRHGGLFEEMEKSEPLSGDGYGRRWR